MKIKTIKTEWFQDYKVPSMFIATSKCTWKCEKDLGVRVCQNSALAQLPNIDMEDDEMIRKYLNNSITTAIIFGGLEPLEQFEEIYEFIRKLRVKYYCDDTVVIYTGFNKSEVLSQVEALKEFRNIIIKFGRFIPNQPKHYDDVLGVWLASPNQFAEVIS